jgi:hypothetical protein
VAERERARAEAEHEQLMQERTARMAARQEAVAAAAAEAQALITEEAAKEALARAAELADAAARRDTIERQRQRLSERRVRCAGRAPPPPLLLWPRHTHRHNPSFVGLAVVAVRIVR